MSVPQVAVDSFVCDKICKFSDSKNFLKFQNRKDDNKSIGGLSNKEVSSWFILQGWYCHQLVW